MKRREFITLLSGAAAWPLAARAQQPEHMRLIGMLMSVKENTPEGKTELSAFSRALTESGWTDGRNLRMEVRWGGGDVNRTRTFAKELVALQPDVILSQGTPGTRALQQEARARQTPDCAAKLFCDLRHCPFGRFDRGKNVGCLCQAIKYWRGN